MRTRPTSHSSRRLERCRRRLRCRWPLVGRLGRLSAIRDLVALREDAGAIPLLLEAAASPQARIARPARLALEALENESAVDALCEEAVRRPAGLAAEICVGTGYRPSDHERACLLLFVTRQLDEYFQEDFQFQSLRLEYERADESVRRSILAVLRSGDRRCLEFFWQRKPLAECTPAEIRFALRSFYKHSDWPRLFRAFLELPLGYGLRILHDLRRTSWEPEDPEHRSLYRQVIEDSRGLLPPPATRTDIPAELFDTWVAQGRVPALTDRPVEELLEALDRATPGDGVRLVAALSGKASPGSEASRHVATHRHWLVRLAGHRLGLCVDVQRDRVEDPVHWVERLAPEHPLLELPPGRATPAMLEALETAPEAAWQGPLGVARRVLQTLAGHRITTGHFEELVVEVDAFAGEFDPVDDTDWTGQLSASSPLNELDGGAR